MSDVTVAAPSGGASAPANEVPVQVDQGSKTNPIGSQAPERQSARESVQEAFRRAERPPPKTDRPQAKPAPKAAEAKVGHNQPPEPIDKSEKPEKIDLRKRPKNELEPIPRGEHGHYAPRKQQEQGGQEVLPPDPRKGQQQPGQPGQVEPYRPEHNRLPHNAPYRDPPSRFHDYAKHEWSNAPEAIRGEIDRMYTDFGRAYKAYRADHDEMETLRPFQQLAKACGTTTAKALSSYVALEDKIRKNPLSGLDTIVNNLNLVTSDGQRISFRDVCYYVATMSPEQYAQIQQGNAQTATAHQIAAARQEIAQLKQAWQQQQHDQQTAYLRAGVDQYADTHPRLDELGDLIKQEIELGFDLDTAYRRADLLRPTAHAAQTRNPSAQTRPQAQDRSITGSPGNSNGMRYLPKPSASVRDAVRNATRQVQGRA